MRKGDGRDLCMRLRNVQDLWSAEPPPGLAAPEVCLLLRPRDIHLVVTVFDEVLHRRLVGVVAQHLLDAKLQRRLVEALELFLLFLLLLDPGHLLQARFSAGLILVIVTLGVVVAILKVHLGLVEGVRVVAVDAGAEHLARVRQLVTDKGASLLVAAASRVL